jgi:hypothetical protein
MKKYSPYIFPLVVVLIVFFLVFRWYGERTESIEETNFGEGVAIENLSEQELQQSLSGVGDYKSIDFTTPQESEQPMNGAIRYEVKDGKVRFSVMAGLPEMNEAGEPITYEVWLKAVDGEAVRQAFELVPSKGGFIGSASLPADLLPFQVIVTEQGKQPTLSENVLLEATIPAEETQE